MLQEGKSLSLDDVEEGEDKGSPKGRLESYRNCTPAFKVLSAHAFSLSYSSTHWQCTQIEADLSLEDRLLWK